MCKSALRCSYQHPMLWSSVSSFHVVLASGSHVLQYKALMLMLYRVIATIQTELVT